VKLALCPDCGNRCSLTATTCPGCGRNIQLGDLIESDIPNRQLAILIYALAVVTGLIGFVVAGFTGVIIGLPMMPYVTIFFLALGALFGYLWSYFGWKWGLLLTCPNLIWILIAVATSKNPSSGFYFVVTEAVAPLISCCIGAYGGALYKRNQLTNTNNT